MAIPTNILVMDVNLDKSTLYRMGRLNNMPDKEAKALTERGQNIELTVLINPDSVELFVLAVNGVPVGQSVSV